MDSLQSNSPYNSACTKRTDFNTPNTSSDDVFEKLSGAALDRERVEVACTRQDIIDEYEKKSAELLRYLDSMESAFDHQRSEYEERETHLRRENEELRLELAHGCRAHVAELLAKEQEREEKAQQVVQVVQLLKSEMEEKESIAQKEHKKAMKLQDMMEDLQLELEKKEEEHETARRREERTRKHIEEENDELRRKAALGWMLGCLSELYLRLDRGKGAGGIMKLVRKVQRELECGNHNVFSTGGGMMMPPKLEYELIQREIRRLINHGTPTPIQPDDHQKLRTSSVSSMLTARTTSTTKAPRNSFTGELPGDRRKKLRIHKCVIRDQDQLMSRSMSAPSSSRAGSESCVASTTQVNPIFLPRDGQPKVVHKHHMACHQDVHRRSSAGTWSEVRLLEGDQADKQQPPPLPPPPPQHEIKRILQGLQSSMTYLLGQERRRRLCNNQRRII